MNWNLIYMCIKSGLKQKYLLIILQSKLSKIFIDYITVETLLKDPPKRDSVLIPLYKGHSKNPKISFCTRNNTFKTSERGQPPLLVFKDAYKWIPHPSQVVQPGVWS